MMNRLLSFSSLCCIINVVAFDYALLLDCGSRGTRLHVYRRIRDSLEDLLPQSKKIMPGLSHYASSPGDSVSYILPLFTAARDMIPAAEHKHTEVFILGTGGLRLLTANSEAGLYDALVAGLNSHPMNPFQLRRDQVLTISGAAEAYFAALSCNFMMGRIDGRLRRTRYGIPSMYGKFKPLVGALDLGGASTQIVFPVKHVARPSSSIAIAESDKKSLHLRVKQPVYRSDVKDMSSPPVVGPSDFWAASFLHYGSEIMRERLFQFLALQAQASDERQSTSAHSNEYARRTKETAPPTNMPIIVRNPCDMVDYRERWHSAGVGHSERQHAAPTAAKGGDVAILKFALFEFVGTGDAAGCSHTLRQVIWGPGGRRAVKCLADSPCPIEGVTFMPHVPGGTELLAMSQFFRAFDAIHRLTPSGFGNAFPHPTLLQMQDAAAEFCSLHWRPEWTDDTHLHSSREELPRRCFEAVFAFTLLRDVYGLGLGRPAFSSHTAADKAELVVSKSRSIERYHNDGSEFSDEDDVENNISMRKGTISSRSLYQETKRQKKQITTLPRELYPSDGAASLMLAHAINGHELSWVLGAALSQLAYSFSLEDHDEQQKVDLGHRSPSGSYSQNLAQFSFRLMEDGMSRSMASILDGRKRSASNSIQNGFIVLASREIFSYKRVAFSMLLFFIVIGFAFYGRRHRFAGKWRKGRSSRRWCARLRRNTSIESFMRLGSGSSGIGNGVSTAQESGIGLEKKRTSSGDEFEIDSGSCHLERFV